MSETLTVTKDTTREVHVHKRRIHIENGPVIFDWLMERGPQFQVQVVEMEWNHGESPRQVEVAGPNVLVSGEFGKRYLRRTFLFGTSGGVYSTAPEWLRDLVGRSL